MTWQDLEEVDLYVRAVQDKIKGLRERIEALEQRLNKEEAK